MCYFVWLFEFFHLLFSYKHCALNATDINCSNCIEFSHVDCWSPAPFHCSEAKQMAKAALSFSQSSALIEIQRLACWMDQCSSVVEPICWGPVIQVIIWSVFMVTLNTFLIIRVYACVYSFYRSLSFRFHPFLWWFCLFLFINFCSKKLNIKIYRRNTVLHFPHTV